MPDDLFLRAAKAGQAEHGIEDRAGVGDDVGGDVWEWRRRRELTCEFGYRTETDRRSICEGETLVSRSYQVYS